MVRPFVSIVMMNAATTVPLAVGSPSPNMVVLKNTTDIASSSWSSPASGWADAIRLVMTIAAKATLNPLMTNVMKRYRFVFIPANNDATELPPIA